MPIFTTNMLIKERRLLITEASMHLGLETFLVKNGSLLPSNQFLPVARGMFPITEASSLSVQASFLLQAASLSIFSALSGFVKGMFH